MYENCQSIFQKYHIHLRVCIRLSLFLFIPLSRRLYGWMWIEFERWVNFLTNRKCHSAFASNVGDSVAGLRQQGMALRMDGNNEKKKRNGKVTTNKWTTLFSVSQTKYFAAIQQVKRLSKCMYFAWALDWMLEKCWWHWHVLFCWAHMYPRCDSIVVHIPFAEYSSSQAMEWIWALQWPHALINSFFLVSVHFSKKNVRVLPSLSALVEKYCHQRFIHFYFAFRVNKVWNYKG